jgi:hypothetical protein
MSSLPVNNSASLELGNNQNIQELEKTFKREIVKYRVYLTLINLLQIAACILQLSFSQEAFVIVIGSYFCYSYLLVPSILIGLYSP